MKKKKLIWCATFSSSPNGPICQSIFPLQRDLFYLCISFSHHQVSKRDVQLSKCWNWFGCLPASKASCSLCTGLLWRICLSSQRSHLLELHFTCISLSLYFWKFLSPPTGIQRKFCGRAKVNESWLQKGRVIFVNKPSKCLCQEAVNTRKDSCLAARRYTGFT